MFQSHDERIRQAAAAFKKANDTFISSLERVSCDAVTRPPKEGGWNAAQIGLHLAMTNEFIAAVLDGKVPLALPIEPGFAEDPDVFNTIPSKAKTPDGTPLFPPATATKAEAVARLRASTAEVVRAIESINPATAKSTCVKMPFGTLSIYQFADFAGAHVVRHTGQLQRTVAES